MPAPDRVHLYLASTSVKPAAFAYSTIDTTASSIKTAAVTRTVPSPSPDP